jgi:hypothetical protein
MKAGNTILKAGSLVFWTTLTILSVLLSHNAILYFTHGGEYGILPEKIAARQDLLWNIAFYVHLPAGIICLMSPLLLFARNHFHTAKKIHRFIGNIYVWVTLILVCPTGMYLALYAKGGLITQIGFIIQGILLFWFTRAGLQKIRAFDQHAHVEYMIRSYAVAAVVLTFRILHIVFFVMKVPYLDNYAISQWLGLTVNLFIAEILVVFFQKKTSQNLKLIRL